MNVDSSDNLLKDYNMLEKSGHLKTQDTIKKTNMASAQIPKSNIIHLDQPSAAAAMESVEEQKHESDADSLENISAQEVNIPAICLRRGCNNQPMIPMYRGIHICSPTFVRAFKQAFLMDSEHLASIINKTPAGGGDMFENHDEQNVVRLFKNPYLYPMMLELQDKSIKEGRYTIPRAQMLMKLFYLSMVDPNDTKGYQRDIMMCREAYVNELNQRQSMIEKLSHNTTKRDRELREEMLKEYQELTLQYNDMSGFNFCMRPEEFARLKPEALSYPVESYHTMVYKKENLDRPKSHPEAMRLRTYRDVMNSDDITQYPNFEEDILDDLNDKLMDTHQQII